VLYAGNRESFPEAFLSRKSMLLWVLKTFHRRRRQYAALRAGSAFPHLEWREFRRPGDAERFLVTMGHSSRKAPR
jgi:hypothetical protein